MLPVERPKGLESDAVGRIIKVMSTLNIWAYRATGGWIGGTWRVGAGWAKPVPVCLLETVGKKTGKRRTTPLLFMRDGERVVVVASQGGRPKHPLWYGNLVANPEVTIQVMRDVRAYRARTADAAERAALWPRLCDVYADYATYQTWTDREIPVVICEPVA